MGLIPPVSGRLEVLGRVPGSSPVRLAYLSQAHVAGFVLPLRAIDVVRMARFSARGLARPFTREDHDLVDFGMRAMGVEALATHPLRSLSGGQQQRVYLAQVLARRADLIVLDEPTSGLDAGGRERYLQAFAGELERGATLVTSTHDIAEAVEYDQVLLLGRPSGRPRSGPRGADGRPAARHVRDPPARPACGARPAVRRRRGRPRRSPRWSTSAPTRSRRRGAAVLRRHSRSAGAGQCSS